MRAAGGELTPADLSAHLDAESASIGERGSSPEGREGIAAFLGKRVPDWPA